MALTSCFWTFFGCWFRKSYSFWLKINIQPAHLCTKLARMPQNRHFCVELLPTVLWQSLGNILVSLVKRLPNRPLMISNSSDKVWGLVLLRTGLAKILKIDEILNTHFSAFLTYFNYVSWGCSTNMWSKIFFLQDFAIMGISEVCTELSITRKSSRNCEKSANLAL